jgi:hypothetical protein
LNFKCAGFACAFFISYAGSPPRWRMAVSNSFGFIVNVSFRLLLRSPNSVTMDHVLKMDATCRNVTLVAYDVLDVLILAVLVAVVGFRVIDNLKW